jgi:hypothetical protein
MIIYLTRSRISYSSWKLSNMSIIGIMKDFGVFRPFGLGGGFKLSHLSVSSV